VGDHHAGGTGPAGRSPWAGSAGAEGGQGIQVSVRSRTLRALAMSNSSSRTCSFSGTSCAWAVLSPRFGTKCDFICAASLRRYHSPLTRPGRTSDKLLKWFDPQKAHLNRSLGREREEEQTRARRLHAAVLHELERVRRPDLPKALAHDGEPIEGRRQDRRASVQRLLWALRRARVLTGQEEAPRSGRQRVRGSQARRGSAPALKR
jgi:hypothetical protein